MRLDGRDLHCCTSSELNNVIFNDFVATRLLWLLLTPQFYAKFNHFQQFQPSISAGAGNVLGYSGGHCHWLARNMEIECAQLTSASATTAWSQFTTISIIIYLSCYSAGKRERPRFCPMPQKGTLDIISINFASKNSTILRLK